MHLMLEAFAREQDGCQAYEAIAFDRGLVKRRQPGRKAIGRESLRGGVCHSNSLAHIAIFELKPEAIAGFDWRLSAIPL